MLGLEGWVDAGYAAATAVNALLESTPHEVVATFDADALLDHRSRRPGLRISHGIHGPLTWPELRLLSATETGGRSLLVLAGPEPDLRWHEWSSEVVALGLRLGVELVIGLGAFPAPVPHTRAVRLAATANSEELAGKVGFLPAAMDVPAGAQAVLEVAFGDAGVPSVGVWARVPHYAAGTPYPEASAALLDELASLTGVSIDTEALHQAGHRARPDPGPHRGQRGTLGHGPPAGGAARRRGGHVGHRLHPPAHGRRAGGGTGAVPAGRDPLTAAACRPPACDWRLRCATSDASAATDATFGRFPV